MRVNLGDWIRENTKDSKTVVEFGAMFFDKLSHVNNNIGKIGIEIWPEYVNRAAYSGCIKIQGDFTKFEELIDPDKMDCAMFIDTLEHLDRFEAFSLISRVKDKFNKIILMIPEGNHPQTNDHFKLGADTYQTHRSTWYENDIKALGFQEIIIDSEFHKGDPVKDSGCIFAVWEK